MRVRAPELGGPGRAGRAATRFIAETLGRVGPGPSSCAGQSKVGADPGAGPSPGRAPGSGRGKTSGREGLGAPCPASRDRALGTLGATSPPRAGSRPSPRLGVGLKDYAAAGGQRRDEGRPPRQGGNPYGNGLMSSARTELMRSSERTAGRFNPQSCAYT